MSEDPLAAVEHGLTVLLRRARAVSAEVAREVHPDLDPAAYGLLVWLLRCGPSRLTELSAQMRTSKGTLSRQISALETMGLVRRQPDPVDRRAFLLEPTDEGRQRLARVRGTAVTNGTASTGRTATLNGNAATARKGADTA